jgi:hypothetical protein
MTTKDELDTKVEASYCADSPTRAHHWVLGAPGTTMIGECKHCHQERTFNPFEENVGFNNSPKKRRATTEVEI